MKILNIADILSNYKLIDQRPVQILKGSQPALIIRNLILTEHYDVLNFKDIQSITDHFAFIVYGSIELDLKIKNYNDQILRALSTTRARYSKNIKEQS